jgi:hypothetical protein
MDRSTRLFSVLGTSLNRMKENIWVLVDAEPGPGILGRVDVFDSLGNPLAVKLNGTTQGDSEVKSK